MDKKKSQYFAAVTDQKELSSNLMGKVTGFTKMARELGLYDKWKTAWASYNGMYWNNFSGSHQVSFGGEQGELSQIPINHIRNLITHMHSLTTTSRIALEARPVNTDPKSLLQAQLGTGLLDYYLREMRLEKYISTAVETALVMGTGWIKVEWDTSKGSIIEEDEETGLVMREGDLEFNHLSVFDVMYDLNRGDNNHKWYITIDFKNRYDLMAKFPDLASKIEELPGKDKLEGSLVLNKDMASDDIPVFTFFHEHTDSLPRGRQVVFLSDEVILSDLDLPYKRIPLFRLSPNTVIGTSIGYGSTFDLLPLQDAVNMLYTAIFSNNVANAVQNIFVETGSNLTPSMLSGNLRVLEGLKPPVPVNFTQSAPETFQLIQIFEGLMQTLSGINSVVRGNPESNLKSGTSLAVVQSQAIQYMNSFQQQYIQLLEDLGTAIIEILKTYATEPRVVSIVGSNNKAYLKEFKAQDIQEINRVAVEVANPLSKTFAGRIQMAEQLMQMKADEFTIDEYIQVINTGRIDVMTNKNTRKLNQIETENSRLMSGTPSKVLILDDHAMHIEEHASLLDDPDVRDNDEIAAVILDHIQQHLDFSKNPEANAIHQIMKHTPVPQTVPPSQQPAMENMNLPQGQIPQTMEQPQPQEMPPQPNMPTSATGQPTDPAMQLATNMGGSQ